MDRLKLLMETLTALARQPDEGTNLWLAGRNIEEYLKPFALNKVALRSNLEKLHGAIIERIGSDPSVSKLFRDIQDLIETHLSRLDDE
jgi:hypothetical protein